MGLFGNNKNADIDKMEEENNIQGLNTYCNNPDKAIRLAALLALERLAKRGVIDASSLLTMNQLLKDSDTFVRRYSARTFARFGQRRIYDDESIVLLNQLLEDPDKYVRRYAAEALEGLVGSGLITDPATVLALNQLAADNQIANQESKQREEREKRQKENMECKRIEAQKQNEIMEQKFLEEISSMVTLTVPSHLESGTSAEIVVHLKNITTKELTQIIVDFSDLEVDFEVDGKVKIDRLRPNAEIENYIRIKPRYPKGTFPVKIKLTGSGVTIEKEYTIKVGGTEIY